MRRALASVSETPPEMKQISTDHWTDTDNHWKYKVTKISRGLPVWDLGFCLGYLNVPHPCRGYCPSSAGQGSLPCCSAKGPFRHHTQIPASNTPNPADALPLLRMTFPGGIRRDTLATDTPERPQLWLLRGTHFTEQGG